MQDIKEVNLFNVEPKRRDYSRPVTCTEKEILGKFGKEYFVSPFTHGYRGYEYSGLYKPAAKNLIDFYSLQDNCKILDVCCAKGFLLHDLKELNPSFQIYGIDISKYAIDNALPSVKDHIVVANANKLPFEDNEFDLVICVNALVNLPESDCRLTIREINRVAKKHKFIQTPAYHTEIERQNLLNWVPVANCVLSVDEWKKILAEEGYDGEYYWFIFQEV